MASVTWIARSQSFNSVRYACTSDRVSPSRSRGGRDLGDHRRGEKESESLSERRSDGARERKREREKKKESERVAFSQSICPVRGKEEGFGNKPTYDVLLHMFIHVRGFATPLRNLTVEVVTNVLSGPPTAAGRRGGLSFSLATQPFQDTVFVYFGNKLGIGKSKNESNIHYKSSYIIPSSAPTRNTFSTIQCIHF